MRFSNEEIYIRNNEREDKIIFARPELRRKNSPRREF
jgi:hypothetical protein